MDDDSSNRPSSGYEYQYRFWMDDEIISFYEPHFKGHKYFGKKFNEGFLFDIRTNFTLKRRLNLDNNNNDDSDSSSSDEIMMDSERLASTVSFHEGEEWLEVEIGYRLDQYWMSDVEIQSLIHEVFNFAKNIKAVDPQRAVVPVVVGIDVSTVQLEGETLDDAFERAIWPGCLIPLRLWQCGLVVPKETLGINFFFLNYLHFVPTTRVDDVDKGLALMEICPICLRAPTISAQITALPNCNHAFHHHCLVQWLLKSKSCPMCRGKVVTTW